MKRILSILIVLLLCLSVFSGCEQNDGDKAQFDFSYSVEKTKYARGETIQITASVTNTSGRTYRYVGCSGNDFIPFISLYNNTDKQYQIACDPIIFPEDVVNKKVKNGESGSIVYSFVIPEDAKLGNYSLTLSLGEDKKEFADILSVVELTAQNETEKYGYSSTIVSSGNNNIQPIACFLGTTQYENGVPTLNGCGDGVYRVFSDPETKISDFPVLVCDGDITATVPVNVTLGRIEVYDTSFQELEYTINDFSDLTALPYGEYLIVFSEQIDGRGCDAEIVDYWITNNENLFRLVIQEVADIPTVASLRERNPEYFGLDTSDGLDVYVWQMAKNSYSFGLLPHAEQGRDWIAHELLNLRGTSAEEMSVILSTYNVDENDIYIIPWQNPISSYLAEWQIVTDGEDLEAKRQAYVEFIRQMLFEGDLLMTDNGEQSNTIDLIYAEPSLSWVASYVPDVIINDGKLYDASKEELLGDVSEITLSPTIFDQLTNNYQGQFKQIAQDIQQNNDIIYSVSPVDSYGVGLYYILIQDDGDIIIIYGYYENGEKTGFIRWIFEINK